MNTVRCSNCGAENAADLRFCTNCGKSLSPSNFGQTPPLNISAQPQKSKTGRNAVIIGGLGCALLLIGSVVLCGILGYIGSNSNNDNSENNNSSNRSSASNNNSSNRSPIKISNSNSVVSNDNSSASNSNNSSATPTDEEFRNFLPPQIGDYERQGDAINGDVTEDYPGADKISKAEYVRKNKKVSVNMAQFASPATAKQSYGYFLDGFKGAGAKTVTRQKIKNKSGIETGDLAIYVYKSKWETLIYADRFGFRVTAPDRVTLGEFLKAFGSYIDLISDK